MQQCFDNENLGPMKAYAKCLHFSRLLDSRWIYSRWIYSISKMHLYFFFQSFFYSRKNFMKPSHQEYPHRNFQEEVEFLNEIFPSKFMKLQQSCTACVKC